MSLSPFLDPDNILRVESQISYFTHLNLSNKPILLDAKEKYTILLIKKYHKKYFHASHETKILDRRFTARFEENCIQFTICKFLRANPFQPRMSALPEVRQAYCMKPFTHCVLDYFGPFQVKIGRRIEKRWGALFTCM